MSVDATVDSAVAAFRGKRAVLVGDLVLDAYLYGETGRVSREAPVLVVREERQEFRLGGAANVAANLAELGVEVRLVGLLGEDEAGARMRSMLGQAGVDASRLRAASWTTPRKTRILAGAIGTARQQVLRIDQQPNAGMADSLAGELAADLTASAADADIVVISDYGIGMVAPAVIDSARALAAAGTPVLVDSRYRLALFAGLTVVKPNAPEAAALVGYPLSDAAAIDKAGHEILERLDCRACLITLGRGGMTLFARGRPPIHVDIVGDEEVTDVTGAGDTVTATFCASLAAGLGMPNAMRLANCAAGVVVMKAGTATAAAVEIVAAARRGGTELDPWGA